MPQVFFRRSILKRFLNDKEMEVLEHTYDQNKKRCKGLTFPTPDDWELFHKNSKPTIKFWMRRWKLSWTGTLARLGKMYLMDKNSD